MSSIKDFLSNDHSRCDELFALMEEAASSNIADAKSVFMEFKDATERHFQMEERIMFEEFEQKTGMAQGPTAVMRHEHTQMRNLLNQMREALEQNNQDRFFGSSETLMILMQQHNMKEEQMLYTMAQQRLSAEAPRIVEMMKSMVVEA